MTKKLNKELFEAVHYGYYDLTKELLDQGADVNARDKYGQTVLMVACCFRFNRNIALIKLLLKRGADVNAQDKSGETVLMWVCGQGDFDLVDLLLRKGANVHIKNKFGETALTYACGRDYNITQELLDRGAVGEEEEEK